MKTTRALTAGVIASAAVAGSLVLAAPASAADVTFTDPALQACVNQQLGQSATAPVSTTQAATVTVLGCNSVGITSLNGLQSFTSLSWLNVYDNLITDITPLASIPTLRTLALHTNQITDITPLTGLTDLRYLDLTANDVTDLTPLAGLTKLDGLDLAGNNISDISALSGLVLLDGVQLDDNHISDLSPLGNLPALHQVYASGQTLTLPPVTVGVSTANPLRAPHGETITQSFSGDSNFVLAADGASWTFTAPADNTVTWSASYPGPVFPAWQLRGTFVQQSLAPEVHPTTIVDDTASTTAGTPITLDVLANDGLPGEPALDPTTLALLDGTTPVSTLTVTGGTFAVVDGVVVFTPADAFTGTVADVTYQVTNADGVTGQAVIHVTVTAAVTPTPTPTPTPTTTSTPATPTTDPTTPASTTAGLPDTGTGSTGSSLASTGIAAWTISILALLLAAAGTTLVIARRKRA